MMLSMQDRYKEEQISHLSMTQPLSQSTRKTWLMSTISETFCIGEFPFCPYQQVGKKCIQQLLRWVSGSQYSYILNETILSKQTSCSHLQASISALLVSSVIIESIPVV